MPKMNAKVAAATTPVATVPMVRCRSTSWKKNIVQKPRNAAAKNASAAAVGAICASVAVGRGGLGTR